MGENYPFGPAYYSKSLINHKYFWPGVAGVLAIIVLLMMWGKNPVSVSKKPPTPTLKAQVFPLNQQLSKPILYSAGTTIYRHNGQVEEKLFEVGSEVLSLVPSNDGTRLAATYKHPQGGSNASGYPYTSLIFWDMNTKRSLPLIAKERTTVRYPQWSDDARYVSFWVNEGEESFIYDTTRRRAIYSVKRGSSNPVSPIVFLPGTSGILYIRDNTLYSAAVDGSRPIALADQVAATRIVNNALVADTPVLSPSGMHVVVYTLTGDLAVVNTTTREKKVVGPSVTSLGFLNNEEVLYIENTTDANKTPPVFRFSLTDGKSSKIATKDGWPQAAVLVPQNSQWYLPSVYPNVGPQLLSKEGEVSKNCSTSEFYYLYNNSNDTRFSHIRQVLSNDGRYLLGLSNNSLALMDTSTCQPYIITGAKPTAMTWMP